MKQLLIVFSLLLLFNNGFTQESIVDFQFINGAGLCGANFLCFEIQVRANQPNQSDNSIELADVNYRFYYPNNLMTYSYTQGYLAGYFQPNIDEAGPLGEEVLDLFGDAFDGTDGLGFIDFTIQVDGNSNAISLTSDWVSTAEVCFDIVEPLQPLREIVYQGNDTYFQYVNFCTQLIWALPEYNGIENLYRFSYLTATEVAVDGGNNIDQLTEEAIHFNWSEDDTSLPDTCIVLYCILIPIELTNFSANLFNEKQAKLQWTTASEQNSDAFVVERRSENETEFNEIGKVQAAGLSNSTLNYEYIDQLPLSGQTFYYRLKMLDLDGSFNYSDIKSVNKKANEKELKLYPNPSNGFINLEFQREQNEVLSIEIFDYTGKQKLMQNELVGLDNGLINHPINLGHLANGYYILKINMGNDVLMQSFQIQK